MSLRIIPGYSPIARVQYAKGGTTTATAGSATATLSSTPIPGNIIVAVGAWKNSTAIRVSAANIVFAGVNIGNFNGTISGYPFVAVGYVHASPGTVITVAADTGVAAFRFLAIEYSGNVNLGVVDVEGAGIGSSGNNASPVTGGFTTQDAVELCIGAFTYRGTWNADQAALFNTPTNSFAIVDQTSTSSNVSNTDIALCVTERITTAALSSVTTGVTIASGTQQWGSNGYAIRNTSPFGLPPF